MIVADCAPYVAPSTLAAVIRVESGGNPFALHVNGLNQQPAPFRSRDEAVAIARSYIIQGFSVDLGLMQVNSRHLASLGVTVTQMLEPYSCDNIRIGTKILAADYGRAAALYGDGQQALRAALSAYNTGSFYRGASYVARYLGNAPPEATANLIKPSMPTSGSNVVNPYRADTAQAADDW